MDYLPRRSRPTTLFILCALVILFVLRLRLENNKQEGEPLIFLYNSYFDSKDWECFWDDGVDGSKGTIRTLRDCTTKCPFTSERIHFNSSKFVLVHVSSYENFGGKPVKTREMQGGQIWTAVQLESPLYGWGYEKIDGVFHWVASYRQDSDIFIPYGWFRPSHSAPVESEQTSLVDLQNSLRNRKTAVLLVSNHCQAMSEREYLVATLRRYMSIDVLGKCSRIPCPETKHINCREHLGQNYKFYLAFENSLCLDYVTEKVFLSYKYGMVPVTFGWVNYSQYVPPGSYINALNYDSVEELAKYLNYLDQHDDEYLKYFAWKGKYNVEFLDTNKAMCTICEAMRDHIVRNGGHDDPDALKKRRRRRSSFKKWETSLPAGQRSKVFKVGQVMTLNVTQKACIQPREHLELQKWIRAGLPVTEPKHYASFSE